MRVRGENDRNGFEVPTTNNTNISPRKHPTTLLRKKTPSRGVSPLQYSHIHIREASGVHDYIKERTLKIGNYIVETRKTVRVIAKEFGVSKSTVHKDLTERLPEINPDLANEVKDILEYHKSVRHLRGGEATKLKYKNETVM
jgi:putative DeoR family transcriptional regulator, stage III sporulation protein D